MARIFIAGCGFAGLATARLFSSRGWEVIGGTHSRESATHLAGEDFPVLGVDICDREALGAAPLLKRLDAVIHCASSGHGGIEQYRAVYLEGARNLAEVLEPGRLVFTGSTSVYAQLDGSWVTEESPAEPDRETGRVLRQTEELVLGSGGVVARLAGIYGPGRSVLLRKFLAGEAVLEAGGARWINQIHREDIAGALLTLLENGAQGLFNVSDNEPLQQRDIYAGLAQRFNRPLPPEGPVDSNRKRGVTNKRVSNTKLRALGWQPRYGSFFDALKKDAALLAALTP